MSNRLKNETSPYLRSHSGNPVDWYPWGEEAFAKAKREDKPIFLSIGYSTCHWCHVMARESFQNASVAEILNKSYVSIKVDREERPDIDAVYMAACAAMTGGGGWPLTVLMTSDMKPFFAGTYLPRMNANGRMGLVSLLTAAAGKWERDRAELVKAAEEISSFIAKPREMTDRSADGEFLKSAAEQLKNSFDKDYGGFGSAPKFPSAHTLIFLMRYAALSGDKAAGHAVDSTLQWMYRGGIYDHIGGGFSRYSTDREWLVPHFEKTLYDNALLALAYTEAWQDGHYALYKDVSLATLDYIIRELKAPEGGYFSGQDADSAGVEGAYYLLSEEEVRRVLGEENGKHFAECYDITPEGNFKGRNIPNLLLNQRWTLVPEGYGEFKDKLREYRRGRITLSVDDKLLTGWNGLMLAALSRAGRVFGEAYYLDRAEELLRFIKSTLMPSGELAAGCCKGEVRMGASLSDYAFLALGALEYYDSTYDISALELAKDLSDYVPAHFKADNGGLYSTSDKAEKLLFRPQEYFDGALPSGASAMAVVLDKLFRMSGSTEYGEASKALLGRLCAASGAYPAGPAFALNALLSSVYPSKALVCVAEDTAPAALDSVTGRYDPLLTLLLKTDSNAERLASIAPFTSEMHTADGKAALYICTGSICSAPITLE